MEDEAKGVKISMKKYEVYRTNKIFMQKKNDYF